MSAKSTRKVDSIDRDTLKADYSRSELGPGVRGKYKAQYDAGTNLVLLEPDVAEVFDSSEAVNLALRSLIGVAQRSARSALVSAKKATPSRTSSRSVK